MRSVRMRRQSTSATRNDRAEREPETRVVELAAEPALVAARHAPAHLRARPGVQHLARAVVDLDLRDLAVVRAGVDVHRPRVERRVVGRVLRCAPCSAAASRRPWGRAARCGSPRSPRGGGCSRSANGRRPRRSCDRSASSRAASRGNACRASTSQFAARARAVKRAPGCESSERAGRGLRLAIATACREETLRAPTAGAAATAQAARRARAARPGQQLARIRASGTTSACCRGTRSAPRGRRRASRPGSSAGRPHEEPRAARSRPTPRAG